MKKFGCLLLICLASGFLQGQKKGVATREETIDYLNQKAREVIGYDKAGISQKIFVDKKTISDGHVKKTATGIEVYVAYKTDTYSIFNTSTFNPKHILSITNTSSEAVSKSSTIGTLEIKFIGKTALYNNNGNTDAVERIVFNFMQSDPANERRVINAFNHLKELYKQEDAYFE